MSLPVLSLAHLLPASIGLEVSGLCTGYQCPWYCSSSWSQKQSECTLHTLELRVKLSLCPFRLFRPSILPQMKNRMDPADPHLQSLAPGLIHQLKMKTGLTSSSFSCLPAVVLATDPLFPANGLFLTLSMKRFLKFMCMEVLLSKLLCV